MRLIEERYVETETPADFDEPELEELRIRTRGENRDDELETDAPEED